MIDASIPLQASGGPAPLNPVQTLAGIGQIRAQQQQQALGDQQLDINARNLDASKRAQVEDQRLRDLFAKGVPSTGELYSTVGPVRGAEILKGLAALRTDQLKTSQEVRATVGSMAGGILALPPTMQADAYKLARENLLTRGAQPEDIPEQFPGPDGLKQFQVWAQTPEQQITTTETARGNAVKEAQTAATAAQTAADKAADNTRADAAAKETARHNVAMENAAAARARAGAGGGTADDADAIAEAIVSGDQPPVLTGLYRLAGPVRSALAKKGYQLAAAMTDWNATQKHISTLNNAQQTRLNQSINALPELLDSVDALAAQWQGGRFPILNRANLALAKGGAYGDAVATVARQLDSQIADVTADLGNVYMGGNSPTDHALELAGKSLSGDWSEKVLRDMVKLARSNVTIRQNSIRNTGVAGASATNPYAPAQPTVGQGNAAPKTAGITVSTPDGQTFQFKSQADADAFKATAGIK